MHEAVQQKTWLTVVALACEVAAAWALFMDQRWLAAAALHVVCAFGLALQCDLPGRRAAALCIGVWALPLPVLGPLGICCVVLPAWRQLRSASHDGVLELELPAATHGESTQTVSTPIELVLRGTRPEAERIAAVLWLRRMEAVRAVPLLRLALGDPYEDVRLLARAMLERREQQLRAAIERDQRALEALPEARRASASAALCEQHFELVHAGFVFGDEAEDALQRATAYGTAALALRADGTTALTLGRIRLGSGDAAGALDYFKQAAEFGVARSVLAPLYAEAAFALRRFDALPPLLAASAGEGRGRPELQAVAEFWCGGCAT